LARNGFPLPNDYLLLERNVGNEMVLSGLVVASVHYDDNNDSATILVLNPISPYFTVMNVKYRYSHDKDSAFEIVQVFHAENHLNIVTAVESYQEWGGDI